MSGWHAPGKTRLHSSHTPTLQELAVFAVGLFVAVMIGIASSGMLPIA
jgi:hypothetical protein